MQLINQNILLDIANEKKISFNLGSGMDTREDMYNLDLVECIK